MASSSNPAATSRSTAKSATARTIKMYLPRAATMAQQFTDMAPAEPIHGGYETVLIVEDDALVRTYVTAQVRALGYRTLAATNAAEALTLIDGDTPIDLLFTDVVMPGSMNGRQLADETRRRRPGIKVLFTSGYTENAIVHHGRLDPGVLLLAKPYRKQQLAQMIRIALGATDDESGGDARCRARRGNERCKRSRRIISAVTRFGRPVFAEHDAHQIGGVLGAELFHDPGAVNFDGAIADAELLSGFLVGGALDDLAEHVLLARRQRLAARKIELRLLVDAARRPCA